MFESELEVGGVEGENADMSLAEASSIGSSIGREFERVFVLGLLSLPSAEVSCAGGMNNPRTDCFLVRSGDTEGDAGPKDGIDSAIDREVVIIGDNAASSASSLFPS